MGGCFVRFRLDRGRLLSRGYRPKPRLCLRCLRVAENAADHWSASVTRASPRLLRADTRRSLASLTSECAIGGSGTRVNDFELVGLSCALQPLDCFFSLIDRIKATSLGVRKPRKFSHQEDCYVEKLLYLRRADPSGGRFLHFRCGGAASWCWRRSPHGWRSF
jgi:hypothetical protein